MQRQKSDENLNFKYCEQIAAGRRLAPHISRLLLAQIVSVLGLRLLLLRVFSWEITPNKIKPEDLCLCVSACLCASVSDGHTFSPLLNQFVIQSAAPRLICVTHKQSHVVGCWMKQSCSHVRGCISTSRLLHALDAARVRQQPNRQSSRVLRESETASHADAKWYSLIWRRRDQSRSDPT